MYTWCETHKYCLATSSSVVHKVAHNVTVIAGRQACQPNTSYTYLHDQIPSLHTGIQDCNYKSLPPHCFIVCP